MFVRVCVRACSRFVRRREVFEPRECEVRATLWDGWVPYPRTTNPIHPEPHNPRAQYLDGSRLCIGIGEQASWLRSARSEVGGAAPRAREISKRPLRVMVPEVLVAWCPSLSLSLPRSRVCAPCGVCGLGSVFHRAHGTSVDR